MDETKDKKITLVGPPERLPQDIIQFTDGGRPRVLKRAGAGYEEISDTPKQFQYARRAIRWATPSLVDFAHLVGKYADPDKALIFHSDKSVLCCLDHTDRSETITHPIKHSLEWLELAATDQDIKQKALVAALDAFRHVLGGNDILVATLTSITMKKDVEIRSDVDRDKISFLFASTAGAQTATLPRELILTMPVFEGGDPINVPIKLDVACDIFTGRDGITFSLSVPTRPRLIREALQLYKCSLTTMLPEPWMIVEGETN